MYSTTILVLWSSGSIHRRLIEVSGMHHVIKMRRVFGLLYHGELCVMLKTCLTKAGLQTTDIIQDLASCTIPGRFQEGAICLSQGNGVVNGPKLFQPSSKVRIRGNWEKRVF